jgi:hypothetical protein
VRCRHFGVCEAKGLKAVETENGKLKRLLADAILDDAALKDLLSQKVMPAVKREAVASGFFESIANKGSRSAKEAPAKGHGQQNADTRRSAAERKRLSRRSRRQTLRPSRRMNSTHEFLAADASIITAAGRTWGTTAAWL